MRSSILARIPGFRQRIIPEPRVPSRGSQARGTRLRPPINLLDYSKVLLDYSKVLLEYCIVIVVDKQFTYHRVITQITHFVSNIFYLYAF